MKDDSADRRAGAARRAVLAGLGVVLTMASLVISASPASAHHTVCMRYYQFVPTTLHAVDIEDWWPDNTDEIQLNFPGGSYSTSIGNGNARYDWEMPESPVLAQVPGSGFNVTLYEWDGSTPRNLGTHTITWTAHSDGRSFFRSGDYSYQLRYTVHDRGDAGCVQYIPVPNTVGQPESVARDILDDNFTVVRATEGDCANPGFVRRQNPGGGELPKWSRVTIYVGVCSSPYEPF